MKEQYHNFEQEINDLKSELVNFEKEKERVRAIIGKIGGVPKFETRLINAIFIIIIVIALVISIVGGDRWRLLMIELTTVMLSVKIIFLIHNQMRVSHFEFWILSALEWRINEMMAILRKMEEKVLSNTTPSDGGP
jgi:predicted ferric reductase